MKAYQITLKGWCHCGSGDDQVKWINANSVAAVERWIDEQNLRDKLEEFPNEKVTHVDIGFDDGVDVEIHDDGSFELRPNVNLDDWVAFERECSCV